MSSSCCPANGTLQRGGLKDTYHIHYVKEACAFLNQIDVESVKNRYMLAAAIWITLMSLYLALDQNHDGSACKTEQFLLERSGWNC